MSVIAKRTKHTHHVYLYNVGTVFITKFLEYRNSHVRSNACIRAQGRIGITFTFTKKCDISNTFDRSRMLKSVSICQTWNLHLQWNNLTPSNLKNPMIVLSQRFNSMLQVCRASAFSLHLCLHSQITPQVDWLLSFGLLPTFYYKLSSTNQ